MKFHIVFNKETWYSKLLSFIFIFGCFPWIVFIIGQRYQESVDLMNGVSQASLDWHNSDYLQDYNPRNNQQYILENKIEGKWKNVSDPKFILIFKDLNRYFEYYDNALVNSGAWFLKQSLVNTKFSNLNPNNEKKEMYLYERVIAHNQTQPQKQQSPKTVLANNKNTSVDLYDNDFIYKMSFSSDYKNLTLTYLETGDVMNFTREFYNPGEGGL